MEKKETLGWGDKMLFYCFILMDGFKTLNKLTLKQLITYLQPTGSFNLPFISMVSTTVIKCHTLKAIQ